MNKWEMCVWQGSCADWQVQREVHASGSYSIS